MNVEIGTKVAQFLFWEFLSKIFGIVSLQCGRETAMHLNQITSMVKETTLFFVVGTGSILQSPNQLTRL
jgi:hypothetical protein